jgi:hypothetical protein
MADETAMQEWWEQLSADARRDWCGAVRDLGITDAMAADLDRIGRAADNGQNWIGQATYSWKKNDPSATRTAWVLRPDFEKFLRPQCGA